MALLANLDKVKIWYTLPTPHSPIENIIPQTYLTPINIFPHLLLHLLYHLLHQLLLPLLLFPLRLGLGHF
jgi:hypothetical protein